MNNKNSPPVDSSLLATPLGFTKGVLQISCYPWAERILHDLDAPGAIAVKAANGAGKTTRLAAPAALWHATAFPRSLTIITSAVFRQVKEQLFPAIREHAHKFKAWKFNDVEIEGHNGSRILGFSSDDPGRAEGFHADSLLAIIDEAKTVSDDIFNAITRCQPNRLMLLSSPGGPQGTFYDAFHSRRKFFRTHSVTAADCPHIDPKWVAEQIEKFGEHHPLVRSMIYGEFMLDGQDGSVIPLSFIERLIQNPPPFQDNGEVSAFCDFAAGGDQNVLAIRRGNRVEIAAAWRERDTMRAVGRFIHLFEEHQLKSENISGDEGGLGRVMCDRLAENGWHLQRVNNGGTPRNEHYSNRGAETWYEGRLKIERGEIILPNDQELIGQLSSRMGWADSRGKLALESKQDMRARGLQSPDKGDAVLGAMERVYSSQYERIRRRHNPDTDFFATQKQCILF